MNSNSLKQVNFKLKQLPDIFLEDVERYIDFLVFKYEKETDEIPEWHKEIVLKRLSNGNKPIDAFEMLNELENE